MKDIVMTDKALQGIVARGIRHDDGPYSANVFLVSMARELIKLRDQLRWRKWPEEKPEPKQRYLVLTDGSTDIGPHVSYYSANIGWATEDAGITHWRPIGPLPGGE